MNLGTIVEAEVAPVYLKNKKLGYIEEYFINQLEKMILFICRLSLKFRKCVSKRNRSKKKWRA